MKQFILSLIAVTTLLTACKKDNVPASTPADPAAYNVSVSGSTVNVRNLPADTIIGISGQGQPFGAGIYSFFNLRTNSWVSNADSNSTNWDLAFSGTTIRVNNATGGPGTGGAFVWVGAFESLTSIPVDSVFRVDNHPVSYAITKGSGKGWYNYDGANNLLTPIPGRVLVIRTANGKYA